MQNFKQQEKDEIIAVNVFKNSEEKRKSLFVDKMVKAIARNEKNLKIINCDG
ncbi:MAG: hypothetical protein ACK5MV_13005 [Aminipila sp.]